jgi:hypothetical protein
MQRAVFSFAKGHTEFGWPHIAIAENNVRFAIQGEESSGRTERAASSVIPAKAGIQSLAPGSNMG